QNVWEDIVEFKAFGATGSGLFEVPVNGWEGRSLNWAQGVPAISYTPTPNGTVTYAYPTEIYTHVWVGGTVTPPFYDANSWANAPNWEDECGGVQSAAPSTTDNAYIPAGQANYPTNIFTPGAGFPGTGTAKNVLVASGASATIGDLTHIDGLSFSGNLDVYGTFTIAPDGEVTVSGATYLDAAQSLVVEATANGIGSFIDNGTITYGTTGTAKVQTYITNGAIVGSFYIHTVGPAVDEENYTGAGTGAFLQAFDVAPGNTFAYSFDEPTNSWVNQFSYTYPVLTTDGIGMSTDDATAYTMNMSGALMTGSITSIALTYTPVTGGNELISNPYASAIDFDLFYANTGNSSVINNKNWVWDAVGGNYLARSGGSGGDQFMQVGQAFFVETTAAGTLAFDNTNRVHSTTPFREVMTNILSLDISGGDYGYYDQLVIRFEEGATTGYDSEIEAIKWNSMYENATQIRSIAEDGTELSINVMPELNLQGDMVSVPVNFQCGYDGEYTFTASDLESFEYGTEIWIEDKQDNYQWHHLSPGHETYTFTASPDDAHDRFIIHFFGPTSVNDFEAQDVLIYGLNEYAYVKNLSKNEVIKEVYIYSLAGTMIMNKQVPEQNIYRFFVSNHDGYYIVRVVTDKNIYTEKVFVH
ncbi:MAG: T9SS type A sorting domain-containing protein, partial [Bacteroidales bacterium]|nr:T9SS type A sorting domain-containing protein [Bacteroidales bacterium]